MAEQLLVGHARRDVTPPVGTRMLGYASRTEPSRGVHDALYANAVALSDGAQRAAILALDVCWLDLPEVAALKGAVRERAGLTAERVLVNCSHTHAGPAVARMAGEPYDEGYFAELVRRSADAVESALEDLRPATLETSWAYVDIGTNRRERTEDGRIVLGLNPEGQTLGEATVWRFRRGAADDVVLWSVPVHGTVLGGDNLEISAEWMGDAVRKVEARYGGLRAVFLQGCCADQNPYRGERSFRQVDRIGSRAADAVVAALGAPHPAEPLPLRWVLRDMALPLAEGGTSPCPIHGMRLGDAVMVGLGGEAFVEYALHARRRARARSILALGYTDGSVGYLPTAAAYDEGGYEPTSYRYFVLGKGWDPAVEAAVKAEIDIVLGELDV